MAKHRFTGGASNPREYPQIRQEKVYDPERAFAAGQLNKHHGIKASQFTLIDF